VLLGAPDAMLQAAAALAPESPIKIDVDLTSIVVLVLFVGLTVILKPLLFDPMLKLFEEREKRIDGAKLEARKVDEKSATALAEYEKAMAKARAVAQVEREKIRAEAVKREQEILARARSASAEALENGKRAVQEEANRARATLKADVGNVAAQVANRVLGRAVQP
jgi:F-type H+-transporting ATPase subunit b